MRLTVYILVNRALRSRECSLLDSCLKFILSWLHQWRVESTTNLQRQCTLSTSSLQFLASSIDSIYVTRDNELTRAVVVSSNYHVAFCAYLSADFLNLLIWQTDDGSHSTRVSLASLLHSIGTGSNKFQTILESHSTSSNQCRELTERVTSNHSWLEFLTQAKSRDNRMEEYSRLGNLSFLQLIVGSGEHDISNLEAENLVGLIKKFFCQCVVIVEILTHTYELRTLSRENKCFHFILIFFSL